MTPVRVVLGSTTSTIRLTPEQPVAIADVIVEPQGLREMLGATVSISAPSVPVRVVSVDPDAGVPRFIDEAHIDYPDMRLGTIAALEAPFHRRVLVWADDPATLPADVAITVAAVKQVWPGASAEIAGGVPVSADWSLGPPPSVVQSVASGELRMAPGDTTTASLELRFVPSSVDDPMSLVPTWMIDAGIVPDNPEGGTAHLRVQPGTTGFAVTLFSPGSGFRSIYQPDTITCAAGPDCNLHYDLTFEGRDAGLVRWQVTAELVDFGGPAPPGRSVGIELGGISSAPGPLDP